MISSRNWMCLMIILAQLFCFSAAGQPPCQVTSKLESIYPVNLETFELYLGNLFNAEVETYTISSGASAFQVLQGGEVVASVNPFKAQNILDITIENFGSNPNIHTNNYAFLTQAGDEGSYQISEAVYSPVASTFTTSHQSSVFSVPNVTCYNVDYLWSGQIAANCLYVDEGIYYPVFELVTNQYTQPIFNTPVGSNATQKVSLTQVTSNISTVTSQVILGPNGEGLITLTYYYHSTTATNSPWVGQVLIFNFTIGSAVQNIVFQLIESGHQTFSGLTNFYVSSDLTTFSLVQGTGVVISNLNNLTIQQTFVPEKNLSIPITQMSIYEFQNYPTNQSYYVALNCGSSLKYYIYQPGLGDFNIYELFVLVNEYTVPFPIGDTPAVAGVPGFLTPYLNIQSAKGNEILAVTGPESDQIKVLWVGGNKQTAFEFNNQMNQIYIATGQNLQIVEIGRPMLMANFNITETLPQPGVNASDDELYAYNNVQSGSINIKATPYSPFLSSCNVTLEYTVLNSRYVAAIYTTQDSDTESINVNANVDVLIPIDENYYGPDIEYSISSLPSNMQAQVEYFTNYHPFTLPHLLVNVTAPTVSKPSNTPYDALNPIFYDLSQTMYAKNFKISIPDFLDDQSDGQFVQVLQLSNNDILVILCNSDNMLCLIVSQISNITQSIKNLDLVYYEIEKVWIIAVQLQKSQIKLNIYTAPANLVTSKFTLNTTVLATDLIPGPAPNITNFLFMQNRLLIVTSAPASVQVVEYSQGQMNPLGALQGPNISPVNIYVNTECYGQLVFVDNTINLLMVELVYNAYESGIATSNGIFEVIYKLPYLTQQPGQTIGIGLVKSGVYIVYSGSVNEIQFIRREYLSNYVAAQFASQSLPIGDYLFSSPVVSSYSNYRFYVTTQSTNANETLNQVLIFKDAPSSFDTLYTVEETCSSVVGLVSAVTQVGGDAAIFLSGNLSNNLYFYDKPQLKINIQQPLNGSQLVITDIDFEVSATSHGVGEEDFSPDIVLVENLIQISQQFNNASNPFRDVFNATNYGELVPSEYFSGQTVNILLEFSEKVQFGLLQQLQYSYQRPEPFGIDAVAVSNNNSNYLVVNAFGVYQVNVSTTTSLMNFVQLGLTQPVYCPVVFQDIFLGNITTVCNANGSAVMVVDNTTSPVPLQNMNAGQYLAGYLLVSNMSMIQVWCQGSLVYQISNLTNAASVQLLNVSMGLNSSSYIQQTLGLAWQSAGQINYQILVVNNTNGSVANPYFVSIDATVAWTNSTQSNQTQFQVLSSPVTVFDFIDLVPDYQKTESNTEAVQILQIAQPSYANVSGSQSVVVPMIVLTNLFHYRFNLVFNYSVGIPTAFYECPYLAYGNMQVLPFASAYNDILVVPYGSSKNTTYVLYQSSNPQVGGNGTDICQNNQPVQIISGYTANALSNHSPVLRVVSDNTVLATAQLPGLTYQQSGYLFVMDLFPAIQYTVMLTEEQQFVRGNLIATNFFSTRIFPIIFANPSTNWWQIGTIVQPSPGKTIPKVNTSSNSPTANISFLPADYFEGSVINIQVQCQNCTKTSVSQQVQPVGVQNIALNTNTYSVNESGAVLMTNGTGIFSGLNNNLTPVFLYGEEFSYCPLEFQDFFSKFPAVVCVDANGTTTLMVQRQDGQSSITLPITNVIGGQYLGGFIMVYNSSTIMVPYLSGNSTFTNFDVSFAPISAPNLLNASFVNISMGTNLSSYTTSVVGITWVSGTMASDFQVNYVLLNFTNPNGLKSNPFFTGFDSSINWVNSTLSPTTPFSAQSTNTATFSWSQLLPTNQVISVANGALQVLQIANSSIQNQTLIAPIVIVTNSFHYRFNWLFQSTLGFPNSTFRCAYSRYGSNVPFLGASAFNDILVVPYATGNNVTYVVYQTANPALGGNGTDVCSNLNSLTVPIIAGFTQVGPTGNLASQASAITTQVLPNNQIAIGNTQQQVVLSLFPNVTISVQAPETTNATVIATNYLNSSSIPITLSFSSDSSSKKHISPWWWLWGSLIIIGVIIIVGGVVYFVQKKKKQGDEQDSLIEIRNV